MNFGQFLSVVAARWKIALLILLAVVSAGILLMQAMPSRYEATASMLVEAGRTADPIGRGGAMMGPEQRTYMATQVQVLGSERVARAVAATLGDGHRQALRQQWLEAGGSGDFERWVARQLNRNTAILPSRESNVIHVRTRADSPGLAADVANAYVDRYIDIAVDLRVQSAQQYLGFFEQQAEEHRLKLEQARMALTKFNQSRGILGADDRQDVESERLAELSKEITVLEAQLAEFTGRDAQARNRADQMREVTTDPVIIAMRTDLQRARTALSEARQSLGDNHPKIQELRQSIADQAARLERETARVTAGLGVERDVTSQRLATLRAAMQAQRERVAELGAARSEASVLLADVESAQRAYDNVINGLHQTRLESQATQGNATLLEAAVPPTRPSSPNQALILAVSVFVGTVLGILAGLVRELFDRRIRTDVQLATLAGQPLLCTVPSFSGRMGKQLRISRRRALGGRLRRLPAS
jgi:polysaccharide biosynthesis transport protein